MDMLVGTSIGGYTLVKLLGTGGMGSVYLANDPAIGQQVAVKIIRTDLDGYTDSASAGKALERFRQEARAVAGLDHLHILPLYRYGEEPTPGGQRAYMIMQYRPEGSLWDWLRRRADLAGGHVQPTQAELISGLRGNWPLNLEEVSEYLQQASSALQYAHERGIVHRDIKPANFLLRIDTHANAVHLLLSDFGLAKVFTASSATNTVLGTPTYMAPEQFEGAARPESDQYALAVMVYYLLAGRPPFEGDPMQLMHQHMTANAPMLTIFNPGVPPAIHGVLARALAKQPEQRFPSMKAFAEAFVQAAHQSSPYSTPGFVSPAYVPSTMKDQPPGLPGLLGLPSHDQAGGRSPKPLILPGVTGPTPGMYNTPAPAAYLAQDTYNTPSPVPTVYPTPAPSAMPGYTRSQQLNGQKINRRGVLGWVLGATALVVAGGGAGIYIYLNSNNQANLPASPSSTPGPVPLVLTGHSAAVTSLSWKGTQLVSGSLDSTTRLWSSDGQAGQVLTATSAVRSLAWSPDGSRLVAGLDDHSVALWSSTGSLIKREGLWGASVHALAWLKTSRYLFVGTYGNGLHEFDSSTYKRYGRNSPGVRISSMDLSPDGRYLALALESGLVYIADTANKWARVYEFNVSRGSALSVAWSADGALIAVGYAENLAVVYDAKTRRERFIMPHHGPVYSVAWRPGATIPTLATGVGDKTITIWRLTQDKRKQGGTPYTGHKDAVLAVAWNSSGSILASASKDKTVILWQPPV